MKQSWMYRRLHKVLLGFWSCMLLALILTMTPVEASANIVNSNQVYSYTIMQRDIERLVKAYPDLVSMETLGQSPYGRQLWAVKLGRGKQCCP